MGRKDKRKGRRFSGKPYGKKRGRFSGEGSRREGFSGEGRGRDSDGERGSRRDSGYGREGRGDSYGRNRGSRYRSEEGRDSDYRGRGREYSGGREGGYRRSGERREGRARGKYSEGRDRRYHGSGGRDEGGRRRDFAGGRDRERGSRGGAGNPRFGAGFDRERFIKKAREETTEVLRSRDMYLAYLSNAVEEEERVANQLVERLEELYGLYFPELKVEDRRNYNLIISKIKREKVDVEEIKRYVGEGKAIQISEAGKNSIGGDFKEKDVENMKRMADEIENIYSLMNRHEKYMDDVAQEVCLNIRYVAGAKISGKLIAAAGGLQKLALMPASTIQVLGAEKALFKHLRNKRIDPPKHGIIFQHTSISGSPKNVRGKIARALATKLAIAVKADVYTKRFIGPQIKDKFDKRLEEILKKTPRKKGENESPAAR